MGSENGLADHQRNRHPHGYLMHYNNTREIWDELRHLCPDFMGQPMKMGELGYIQWPCRMSQNPIRGVIPL